MEKVEVLLSNKYEIFIQQEPDFGKIALPFIKQSAILFFDFNISKQVIEKVQHSFLQAGIKFKVIIFDKCGEDVKSFNYFHEVSAKLIEMSVTRKDVFVAIGGGTVGDFVGFLASTFMRGVEFIQIPTTLLAMVDSSVGGKVAINLNQYKNCIGAFLQPKVVIIDLTFLKSLPKMELISGYAEVLKYGFIKSRDFFDYLIKNELHFKNLLIGKVNYGYLQKIIGESCKIKADFVCQDENETLGIRDLLNFGHTFAHAFESLYLGKIPHGVAVGIGMFCACKASNIQHNEIEKHYKEVGLYKNIADFCNFMGLNLPKMTELLNAMKKDKKNSNDKIKLILLEEIGFATTEIFDERGVENILVKVI